MKKLKIFVGMLANAMLIGMMLLVYLDERNPFMQFLTSFPSKIYMMIMCIVALIVSVMFLLNLSTDDKNN